MTRQKKSILFIALSFALGTTLLLSACSASTPSSTSTTKSKNASVVAALVSEPASLNPVQDTNLDADNVFQEVFDGLTSVNSKGAIVPGLATSWKANSTLTTWTYTLRKDAYFSDGTNVTADDVVFTYNTAKTETGSKLAALVTDVKSVAATSKYEVTFTLAAPYAPFPNLTTISVVPKAAYTKMGSAAFAQSPVGSGPYTFSKWNKGVSIVLKRNEKYWGTKGTAKSLTYDFVADDTARSSALQSGSLDVGLTTPAESLVLKKSSTVQVDTQPSNQVVYLGMNQKANPVLANLDVRKAMSLAIDKAAISEKLLDGSVKPTSQLIAPSVFGYDKSLAASKYDAAQAKKLITASGFAGKTITLSYATTGLPSISQTAQAVASYLEAAGLKVTLDGQEAGTFAGNWFADKLPGAYIFAFAPSTMDADLPYLLLAKSGNEGSFTDATIDAASTAEVEEGDKSKRLADFATIAETIQKEAYYVPLYTNSYVYGVKKGTDWTPRPDGFVNF